MSLLKNDLDVILQTGDDLSGFTCEGFTGVPVVYPSLIVVQAFPGHEHEAAALATALRRTLVNLSPLARLAGVPCDGGPLPSPFSCHATRVPTCQKLLVLLGNARGNVPESLVDAWQRGDPDSYRILTVFPSGADLSALPPELGRLNAAFWKDSVAEAVPAVLSRAGVSSEEFRIFVSYKRLDAEELAEQLFDALTHAGFDVFLDRFSIEPGVDFQVRLTQELADKSMMLLLESANLGASKWTQHEISFAKKHALGLMSILLPDGKRLKEVGDEARIKRDDADWVPGVRPGMRKLADAALEEVVLLVKEEHGRAMARRRQRIRDAMRGALALEGITARVGPDGLLECEAQGRQYALWLTTRPPDLPDFHFTHARVRSPARGVVIGPTASLETLRMARTTWLADRCEFVCYDEGKIRAVARRIARGAL